MSIIMRIRTARGLSDYNLGFNTAIWLDVNIRGRVVQTKQTNKHIYSAIKQNTLLLAYIIEYIV